MGKKSKKQSGGAKDKTSSNASSVVSGGKDMAGDSMGGGGILASGKKQKCFRCLASLKEPSKAHACPGCSLLYCWRCERKFFAECPKRHALHRSNAPLQGVHQQQDCEESDFTEGHSSIQRQGEGYCFEGVLGDLS